MSKRVTHRTISLDEFLTLYQAGKFDAPEPLPPAPLDWNGFAEIIEVPETPEAAQDYLRYMQEVAKRKKIRPKLY